MKLIAILVLAMVAVSYAAEAPPLVKLLQSQYSQNPEGGYQSQYELDDGTAREEEGQLKDAVDADEKPIKVLVAKGSVSYVDPDGNTQAFTWIADENGYRAIGDSIPKRR